MKQTLWKRIVCLWITVALTFFSASCGSALSVRDFDPEPPQLYLHGSQTILIPANDAYIEPGYHAQDSYGNDLSAMVTVSGTVDTGTPGVYNLRYAVSNGFGRFANAERTVYVVSPNDIPDTLPGRALSTGGMTVEPNGNVIYLTFDDGPSIYTEQLLDILGKYGIKASFFVIQSEYLPLLQRIAEEGHTVAIHTYSHRYSTVYANDGAFLADMQKMQDVILQHTGSRTTLVRFPGGSSNTISRSYSYGIMRRLTQRLQAMGYQYFDWNVDSMDASTAHSAEEVYRNVINGIGSKKYAVVLQHDTQEFSIQAVEKIIVWGLCNGYTFLPLTADSPTCHHIIRN